MKNRDVLILGGGIAGLTAAQELQQKGLKVCLLEASPFVGGKLISGFRRPFVPPREDLNDQDLKQYLSSGSEEINTDIELPIEHGFRVYPENYRNFLHIMNQIPTPSGERIPEFLTNELRLASYVQELTQNTHKKNQLLAKLEALFFGVSLYLPYVTCEKRAEQFDLVSIEDFFALKHRSPELYSLIYRLTDSLSSGMVDQASVLAVINILMNYYYAPGRTGFRTFNRPTHLALLQHWERYLESLGVEIIKEAKVTGFEFEGVRPDHFEDVSISGVHYIKDGKTHTLKAPYVICALPVDAVRRLMEANYEMVRYDSRLLDLFKITTLPATGVQLYYETPIMGFEKQLIAGSMMDHPWGISFADQASYWKNAKEYTKDCGVISIYTSILNQPGRYIKKSMQQCTPNEIAYEMFMEVENDLKSRGLKTPKRIGYSAHAYRLKPHKKTQTNAAVTYHFEGNLEEDQLHLCTKGMRQYRPTSHTFYLGNMLLCGAYTKNQTYHVSTMEAACESGRRGASHLLKLFEKPGIEVHEMYVPAPVEALRKLDQLLYLVKLPNPLQVIHWILKKTLDNRSLHMDAAIREYENLHW